VHIAADEVAHARKDAHHQARYELLNYLDGLVSSPEQLRPLPTAVESSDGRIYFVTRGSVVWVDPANIAEILCRRLFGFDQSAWTLGCTTTLKRWSFPHTHKTSRLTTRRRVYWFRNACASATSWRAFDKEWHDARYASPGVLLETAARHLHVPTHGQQQRRPMERGRGKFCFHHSSFIYPERLI